MNFEKRSYGSEKVLRDLVVLREIAHHFGIGDERLRELDDY